MLLGLLGRMMCLVTGIQSTQALSWGRTLHGVRNPIQHKMGCNQVRHSFITCRDLRPSRLLRIVCITHEQQQLATSVLFVLGLHRELLDDSLR